jgi:hydrogenase maturation protease
MTSARFPVLILGYGNLDREDDGVAWHILTRLAARLNLSFAASPEEYEFTPGQNIDLFFELQLYPELAEILNKYARVCFVDAHTGAVPEEIHLEQLDPHLQSSPFTHHLTAASLLSLTKAIYHTVPPALLASVRGYRFGFAQQLSADTDQLANQAVEQILEWLEKS